SVLSLHAMVEITGVGELEELDELYDEVYGRSFFVRESGGDWDTRQVASHPHAAYRLRVTPGDDGKHLLTVQVMADRDGKCGAAQVVHLMNVMCGLEETLGLEATPASAS